MGYVQFGCMRSCAGLLSSSSPFLTCFVFLMSPSLKRVMFCAWASCGQERAKVERDVEIENNCSLQRLVSRAISTEIRSSFSICKK